MTAKELNQSLNSKFSTSSFPEYGTPSTHSQSSTKSDSLATPSHGS